MMNSVTSFVLQMVDLLAREMEGVGIFLKKEKIVKLSGKILALILKFLSLASMLNNVSMICKVYLEQGQRFYKRL